ncbi:MAG TPA: hypothetical protein VFS59_19920 [Gemmatimonadaceae bacterium]|nr:hypothetical protein [Gemmatimonadaceae bacterium]
MRSSVLLSLATLGLSAATIAAPSAQAQSNSRLIVCRDGSRFESTNASVCARHRGVDGRATAEARRNDGWDDRRDDRRDHRRDDRDDRRDRRDDRDDRWDDRRSHDPRYDPNGRDDRGYGYGYGGRREVYEWAGVVDKEVQIQLRGGRAYVRGIGNGDDRASRGRIINGLPQQPGNLVIQRLAGRGEVSVIEQPSARNGYTATFRIRDPRGGADRYRIAVYFEPVGGRYGYGR